MSENNFKNFHYIDYIISLTFWVWGWIEKFAFSYFCFNDIKLHNLQEYLTFSHYHHTYFISKLELVQNLKYVLFYMSFFFSVFIFMFKLN